MKLRQDFDIDDDRSFPRYTYNARNSTLTVLSASPVHEVVVQFLTGGLHQRLPTRAIGKNSSDEDFEREYESSEKVPDLAIIERASGNSKIKRALEVGFAQRYRHLLDNMHMWLKGKESEIVNVFW